MNWIIYSLIAITIAGTSDIFRKAASAIKDSFAANLYFQLGSITAAIILFLIFSRNPTASPKHATIAFVGGLLISTFTMFSFKALTAGPGASTVMPVLRVGGIVMTVVLGVIFLRERLSVQTLAGLLFSVLGIYLLFSQK